MKRVFNSKEFFYEDLTDAELKKLGLKHQNGNNSKDDLNLKQAKNMEYEFNLKKKRTASSGGNIFL